MIPALKRVYGNQTRIRVCGLCWRNGELLMVNHKGLADGDFWAPPGGGIQFLESADECLKREFVEETGLRVSTGKFLFACEFIRDPLHAIELFFDVVISGGDVKKGEDPELPIISEVRFMTPGELSGIPESNLHGIFRHISSPDDLKTLTGFFRI